MKPDWFKSRHAVRLSQVVQIAWGLLLVMAATSKALFLRAGASVGADSLFRSPLILASVVFPELVIGIWFLILPGFFPRLTRGVAVSFFGLLACFSGYAALMGQECHCFGTWPIPAVAVFAIDLVAVALLVSLPVAIRPAVYPYLAARSRISVFAAAVLFYALPLSIWAGRYVPSQLSDLGIVSGNSRLVVLQPRGWVGKRFPLEPYVSLPSRVMGGEWLVVLHRRDCPHCQELVPQLVELAKRYGRRDSPRLALIDILATARADSRLSEPAGIVCASLSPDWKWFVRLPVVLPLANGRVTDLCEDASRILHFYRRVTYPS